MTPERFHRSIAERAPGSVYLFLGPADLLAEEAWKALVRVIFPGKSAAFGFERLSAKEATVSQIVSKIAILPMFGTRRLIMVHQVETWPEKERKALLAHLEKPIPTGCLVLRSQNPRMEALEAAVSKCGEVVLFEAPKEWEAPRWVQERSRIHGKAITPQAATLLVELIGTDLGALDLELEKLAVYCGDRDRIDVEDVKLGASAQRVENVFELMRHIGEQKSLKAVSTLRRLLETGQAPLAILGLLARQARQIWQVKELLGQGMNQDRMAQVLKLPRAAVRSSIQNARHFSEADLRRIHAALGETDIAFKSGGTSPELLLQALVLTLAGG